MLHLVTPFPFLLDFSFYAPLLLRLTLGVYVLAIGFSAHWKNEPKRELTAAQMAYHGVFIAAGIALIVGIYTQIAAIVVAILLIISISDQRARLTHEINRAEISLLLVIALSLLLTGAGPLAIDYPL